MRRTRLAVILAFLATSLAAVGPQHHALQVYVFGDSFSDNGNLLGLHPELGEQLSPPYDPDRFSNGPIWVDYMSQVLRTTITPAVEGGSNYAVAAATISAESYYNAWPDVSGFAEVDRFLADHGAADPEAIYIIWLGANDIDPPADYTEWCYGTLVEMIGRLHAAGARQFLVPNLPALGSWPLFRDYYPAEYAQELNEMTVLWNELLQGLAAQFPDSRVRVSDVDRLKRLVERHPALFGFSNTTDACWQRYGDGTICSNPEGYWFWDEAHPTTHTHRVLSTLFVLDLLLAGEIQPHDFRH